MHSIFRRSSNNVKTYGSNKIVKEMYVGKRRMVEYNSLIISTSIILHYTLEVWGMEEKELNHKIPVFCQCISTSQIHAFFNFLSPNSKGNTEKFPTKDCRFTYPESDRNPEVKSEYSGQDTTLSCLLKTPQGRIWDQNLLKDKSRKRALRKYCIISCLQLPQSSSTCFLFQVLKRRD